MTVNTVDYDDDMMIMTALLTLVMILAKVCASSCAGRRTHVLAGCVQLQ